MGFSTTLRRFAFAICLVVSTLVLTDDTAAQFGPPPEDLKLWLTADEGIVSVAFGVVAAWEDQGPGPVFHDSVEVVGEPILESFDFVNGPHDVVTLGSGSGFRLDNEDDMFLSDLSIYAVVIPPNAGGQTIVGNYKDATGFVLGLSDFTASSIKWFTAGAGFDSLESGGVDVTEGVPVLLTATVNTTGEGEDAVTEKRVFLDRTLLTENLEGVQPLYPEPPEHNLTIGYLIPGGGPSQFFGGSIAEILIYETVSEEQREAVETYLTQKYFTEGFGPAEITVQPQSQNVPEGDSVTFSVTASGTLPFAYEWRRDNVVITGATGSSYTIDLVTRADQGAEFQVTVSNGVGSDTSNTAILTVIDLDDTPPQPVSASRSLGDETRVFVVFDEVLSEATASVAGNYSINNGILVNDAQVVATSPNTVILTTSAIAAGSVNTLEVSGVEDILGNAIGSAQIGIVSPVFGPPPEDLKLWLSSGTGVATDGPGTAVTGWYDQADNAGVKHDSIQVTGNPTIASVSLLAGDFPAMRFDGSSCFRLDNEDDMFLENLSVYALIIPTVGSGQTLVGNYKDATGFVLGQSDNFEGEIKWYTAGSEGFNSMEADTGVEDFQTGVPAILSASYGDGLKSLYLTGFPVVDFEGAPLVDVPIEQRPTYPEPPQHMLTVGALEPCTRQFFTGDVLEILIYSSVSSSQRAGVETYLRQKYFTGGGGGAPNIAAEPESQSISEGDPVTFCVAATGALPFTYEWFRDGAPIDGATEACYTIDVVSRTDQDAEFTVTVTNSFGSETSEAAILTVTDIDEAPPLLVSARRSLGDDSLVFVNFDEDVTDASASVSTNYVIDGGVTVNSAQLVDGTGTVVLSTSPISVPRILRVSNVEDPLGNIIFPNSSTAILVSASGPPQQDLKLWLAADTGLVPAADDNGVTAWFDQALNAGVKHDSVERFGRPTLETFDFPRGTLPVVRFDGSDGFRLDNEDDMFIENVSIYAVIIPEANSGQTLVGNYKDATGFVLGQSDNLAGEIKWFTANPVHSLEANTGMPDLETGVPVRLTATINGGLKSLYQDGVPVVGSEGPLEDIDVEAEGPTPTYEEPPEHALTVGVLEPGNRQFFTGDIAEILIYSSVSESQRDEVWAYLQVKYFDDMPPEPMFRRGDHDGSGLADITDGLNLLGFLFLGTTPPICGNASDFDNSGLLDITDALILLGHLFLGQPNALPAPGTSCGPNPATPQPEIPPIPPQDVSDLGCDKYPGDNFPEAACP